MTISRRSPESPYGPDRRHRPPGGAAAALNWDCPCQPSISLPFSEPCSAEVAEPSPPDFFGFLPVLSMDHNSFHLTKQSVQRSDLAHILCPRSTHFRGSGAIPEVCRCLGVSSPGNVCFLSCAVGWKSAPSPSFLMPSARCTGVFALLSQVALT